AARDREPGLVPHAAGRLRAALHEPRRRRRSPAPRADPAPPGGVTRAARGGKRPPRARAVTTAGDAVRAALALHGLADEIRGGRVLTEWAELVGPRIAQRTRPDRIVDRALWIEVATSAWLHELTLLKPQLLRGLRERLGEPALFDDLRLRLAGGGP